MNHSKIAAELIYPCYICGNEYPYPKYMIDHILNVHGYVLESRQNDMIRPKDRNYSFKAKWNGTWDIQRYGCPSCWFHCSTNYEELMEHIMVMHNPSRVNGFIHPITDNNDEIMESDDEKDELEEDSDNENNNSVSRDILNGLDALHGYLKKATSNLQK